MSLQRVSIFDFDFISANNLEEVVAEVLSEEQNNINGYAFLITPNAYQVVHFNDKKNQSLKERYRHAAYILPDGMPIVWVSKIFKNSLSSRLTGSDLFPLVWQEVKQRQYPVTLVLPGDPVALLFKQDYPAANSFVPRMFTATDTAYISSFAEDVAEGIIKNHSRFVFLGLGFPKQELLALCIADKLKEKDYEGRVLFLLLGASFEFYFGLKERAPSFFQKTGLEWLYRFAKEPARLWKRYTIDNARFLLIALKEMLRR